MRARARELMFEELGQRSWLWQARLCWRRRRRRRRRRRSDGHFCSCCLQVASNPQAPPVLWPPCRCDIQSSSGRSWTMRQWACAPWPGIGSNGLQLESESAPEASCESIRWLLARAPAPGAPAPATSLSVGASGESGAPMARRRAGSSLDFHPDHFNRPRDSESGKLEHGAESQSLVFLQRKQRHRPGYFLCTIQRPLDRLNRRRARQCVKVRASRNLSV